MSKQPGYLKMSEIITLSNNYNYHRNNITNIKAATDHSNIKRDKKNIKLIQEKGRYWEAIRNFQKNQQDRENKKIVERIASVRGTDVLGMRSTSSRKSLQSSLSAKSIISTKQRLKNKEIQRQNQKIAKRIINPKSPKHLALYELDKSFRNSRQIIRIRSRFSNKNQKIVASLALKTLHMSPKSLRFLPQITHRTNKKVNI